MRDDPDRNLERLTSTVEQFCAWVESLPERTIRPQAWGPREVLAHLVYHHESYVTRAEALLAGRKFILPTGRFSEINSRAVERFRALPVSTLTKRLRAANRRLCRLARERDPRNLSFRIKQDSKSWRLSDLIPAVEAHIRNHMKKLRRESGNP
jgi:hypothetical protein